MWNEALRAFEDKFPKTLESEASADLPERLRTRLPEAQVSAEANVGQLERKVAKHRPAWEKMLSLAVSGKKKKRESIRILWRLADELARAAMPLSACRQGCAHCCHIPVALSRAEAHLVGGPQGRVPAPISGRAPLPEAGYDNPCPFLNAGRCSVYETRPLACRLQFNMDRDPLLCELVNGVAVPVPLLNTLQIQMAYALVCQDEILSDIRHFFPNEPDTRVAHDVRGKNVFELKRF